MSTLANFPSTEQYLQYRAEQNALKRRWCARNPDRVRVYRARNAVHELHKSIERQRARRAELESLLELDDSTLAFVHETCRENIRATISRLEVNLQSAIEAHSRAVAKLETMEASG